MVCRGCKGTHQCPGNGDNDQNERPLEQTAAGAQGHRYVRHLDNCLLHQSSGWRAIQTTTRADLEVTDSIRGTKSQHQSDRQGQHRGGNSVERDLSTHRKVSAPVLGRSRVRDVRPSTAVSTRLHTFSRGVFSQQAWMIDAFSFLERGYMCTHPHHGG